MKLARHAKAWLSASGYSGDVMVTTGTNLLLAAMGLLTGALAARLLGPQGRGELAAIQNWPVFLSTLAGLGLADALVFFCSRSPERASRYIVTAVTTSLAVALPVVLIGYVALSPLLAAQSPGVLQAARFYLLIIPLVALGGLPAEALRGLEIRTWNLLRPVPTLLWLGTLLAAVFLDLRRPEPIAETYVLVTIGYVVLVWYVVHRRVHGRYRALRPAVTPMLRFGVPSMLGSIPQGLNLRLDQLLMVSLVPSTQLGLYAAAFAWSNVLNPVLMGISLTLFPRVAQIQSPAQQATMMAQLVRIGVLLALLSGAVAWLVTPFAVRLLFGARFLPSVSAARVLVVAAVVLAVVRLLEDGLRGLGQTWAITWSEGLGLVVTAILLWAWLRPFGMLGAAYASVLSYSVVLVCLITFTVRATRMPALSFLLPGRSDIQLLRRRLASMGNSLTQGGPDAQKTSKP
jgi:enterobacterial common antigen flippase